MLPYVFNNDGCGGQVGTILMDPNGRVMAHSCRRRILSHHDGPIHQENLKFYQDPAGIIQVFGGLW
jgi:hypothetical protein